MHYRKTDKDHNNGIDRKERKESFDSLLVTGGSIGRGRLDADTPLPLRCRQLPGH